MTTTFSTRRRVETTLDSAGLAVCATSLTGGATQHQDRSFAWRGGSHLRQKFQGSMRSGSIHPKVPLIERENRVDLFPVCQVDERGVGQLGSQFCVLSHEGGYLGGIVFVQSQDLENAVIRAF